MKKFYMTKSEKVKDDYREALYVDTLEKFVIMLRKGQYYKKNNGEDNIYDSLNILFENDFHIKYLSESFNSTKVLMSDALRVLDIINCKNLTYEKMIEMQKRLFNNSIERTYFVSRLLLIDMINEKLNCDKFMIRGLPHKEKIEYFEEFLRINPETFDENIDMLKDIQNLDFDSVSEIIEEISKKELEFLSDLDISYEDKFNAIKEIVSKKNSIVM